MTHQLKIYGKNREEVARIKLTDTQGNVVTYPGLTDLILMKEPSGEITIPDSVVTITSQYALRNRPITRVHAPGLRSMPQYAFTGTSIERIEGTDFPVCNSMAGAFESISTLTYAEFTYPFGGSNSIGYCLRNCTNLVEAHFPNNVSGNIDRIGYGCTKLELMDCGKGNISHASAFSGATALRTLILRKADGIQTMNAWSANCMGGIYNNPTESTIYIPEDMYDHLEDGTALDYTSATNWSSAYSAGVTFAKIEGSEYEL